MSSPLDSWCNGCLQWLSPLIWPATRACANTSFLCFLQAASKSGRAASQGLTWSPFGKGRWEAQEHEGAKDWCVLKAAQLLPESSSACRAEGALGGAAFALPGMHRSMLSSDARRAGCGGTPWGEPRGRLVQEEEGLGLHNPVLAVVLRCPDSHGGSHRVWFRSLSSGENSVDPFPPPSGEYCRISCSKEAEAVPARAPVHLFPNLTLTSQFRQREGQRSLTHKLLTSSGQAVRDHRGTNVRGQAEPQQQHQLPQVLTFSLCHLTHINRQPPRATGTMSASPKPPHPSSPTSSFLSLHLPPLAGLWQAALAPLRVCSQGDAGGRNAQFPRMSPNCACLRLRKEAGVSPPSLSGSGPMHSPFPPTVGANSHPPCQPCAWVSGRRLFAEEEHPKSPNSSPGHRARPTGSRRWVSLTLPSLLPMTGQMSASQQMS